MNEPQIVCDCKACNSQDPDTLYIDSFEEELRRVNQYKETQKIRVSFWRPGFQAAPFTVTREFRVEDEVVFAEILFCIWPKWLRRLQGFPLKIQGYRFGIYWA